MLQGGLTNLTNDFFSMQKTNHISCLWGMVALIDYSHIFAHLPRDLELHVRILSGMGNSQPEEINEL